MSERFSLSLNDYQFEVEVTPDQVNWQDDFNIRVGKKETDGLLRGQLKLFNVFICSKSISSEYNHLFPHVIMPKQVKSRQQELDLLLQKVFLPQLFKYFHLIQNNTICDWIPAEFKK